MLNKFVEGLRQRQRELEMPRQGQQLNYPSSTDLVMEDDCTSASPPLLSREPSSCGSTASSLSAIAASIVEAQHQQRPPAALELKLSDAALPQPGGCLLFLVLSEEHVVTALDPACGLAALAWPELLQ